jgi:hypothetical protein
MQTNDTAAERAREIVDKARRSHYPSPFHQWNSLEHEIAAALRAAEAGARRAAVAECTELLRRAAEISDPGHGTQEKFRLMIEQTRALASPSAMAERTGAEATSPWREIASGVPILDEAVNRLMQIDQASVLALADIAIERARQIEAEGWSAGHDDAHPSGELATAAAAYALAWHTPKGSAHPPPSFWPWEREWWKPKSKHRNCVRAGALLVAELARHLRSALPSPPASEGTT